MAQELCDRCYAASKKDVQFKGVLTIRVRDRYQNDAWGERIIHMYIEEDGDVVKTACGEMHSVQSPALGRAR